MIAQRNSSALDALKQGGGLRTRAMERVSGVNESQLIVHGVLAREMNATESGLEQPALYASFSDAIVSKPSETEIEQRGFEAFGKAALTVLLCVGIAGGTLLMLFVSF